MQHVLYSDPETVLRSVPLCGTNGLTVDGEDHLIIASIGTQSVLVMDTDTGQIIRKFSAPLITAPDDVAIGKDGSIYFTDVPTGNIGRISPKGQVSVVENLGQWINALRVSPKGDKLYVSHCIGADKLTEVDLTGKAKPKVLAEGIGWPNSMAFGPDGYLYTPLNRGNQILRWNTDTGEHEVAVPTRSIPSSVKFDSKGRMLVTEFLLGRLVRYDLGIGERTVISDQLPTGLDNVAVDSKDRMFVSSNHNGGIVEVYEDGRLRELSPPGLLTPSSVAILATPQGDRLIVSDFYNIRFYDTESLRLERTIHTGFYPFVKDDKELGESTNLAFPIAVASAGNTLVIASWQNNTVQVFDLVENCVVRTVECHVPIYAIKFGDDLIVSEYKNQGVVSISPEGKKRILVGGIAIPTGLAVREGNLWAADWSEGQILKVISNGEVLAKPTVVVTGLSQPEGIAVTPNGDLLVVETGIGRLLKVNLVSAESVILADNLKIKMGVKTNSSEPPKRHFSGVAIGSDGSIYVSCDEGREVVRLRGKAQSSNP